MQEVKSWPSEPPEGMSLAEYEAAHAAWCAVGDRMNPETPEQIRVAKPCPVPWPACHPGGCSVCGGKGATFAAKPRTSWLRRLPFAPIWLWLLLEDWWVWRQGGESCYDWRRKQPKAGD